MNNSALDKLSLSCLLMNRLKSLPHTLFRSLGRGLGDSEIPDFLFLFDSSLSRNKEMDTQSFVKHSYVERFGAKATSSRAGITANQSLCHATTKLLRWQTT